MEGAYRSKAAKDESHETTEKVAVSPAGGLECRPEVAVKTALAGLAMIQEKAVRACHSVVVGIVNNRDSHRKCSGINGGG